MSETVVNEAKSDALRWQADARNRPPEQPAADDLDRERVRALGSPGADTAAAVLSVTGWHPTPLGDEQQPSGDPLASCEAIHAHYRNRHSDGAGLVLGEQPGATLVAVHGTAKAWRDWYAVNAVETSKARYDDGSGKVTSYRDMGRPSTVSWQPPPGAGIRTSGVAVGRAELNAAAEAMRPRHVGASEVGWLVWAVPVDGRRLVFPDRLKLGSGLDVLGRGVVPLHAVRGDGWRVRMSGLPLIEEMPAWLATELGGRYGKRRA